MQEADVISKEAIDAAAEALEKRAENDDWEWRLGDAQAALEAAAPFLRAQALEDAAEALELPGTDASGYYSGECHSGYTEAERHADTWLRARAATERGQG